MGSPDAEVDALFELPPEEFTAARDRLAKELAGGGDREASRAVKALRRPSLPAWAVNLTVRRHREEFERLLVAGREVRAAQRRAASGLAAPAFASATAERRRLVRRLTDLAAEIMSEAGRGSRLGAVAATFEAAASQEAAAAAVAAGRLSKELTPPAGFEAIEGLEVLEGEGDAAAAPARPDPGVARAEREVEKWRTRLSTAREEHRAMEREEREAAGRIEELERDLARARRDAAATAQRLERIRKRAEEAERRLEEATARLEGERKSR